MDRKRLLRNPLIWIVVLFVVYLAVSSLFSDTRGYTQASTSLALQQVDARNVADVTVEDKEQRLRMTLVNPVDVPPADGTSGAPVRTNQIYAQYPAAAGGQIFSELRQNPARDGFDTQVTQESLLGQMLIYLIPLALVLVMLFWLMNAQGGGNRVLSFGKSKAKQLNKDMPKTTFADVAGANEAVEELYEIKDFLQNPTRYQALGAKIPKGVLLYGPPGTGKTLLARAVAGEAGVPFYTISGSDFVEMFVGVGASRVRDLFEQAKQNSPCIVFVDEIDAVGRHRGAGMGGGHDEREQTLNQLLVEMDGFDARGGIILIAATNRPDILDPALLRPGRFDRQIPVAAPDLAGRRAILEVHAKGKPFAPDVDLDGLAKRTVGFSGADLANVINEAALLTARLNQQQITGAALEESVDRVIGGPARKSRIISEQEKKVAAYHEAGHALAAWAMPDIEPVYKVTILPRGRTGGHALVVPEDDKELMTRSEMIARLVFAMGGRSAEELVFHEPTTGASSDIEQATKIARAMVTEYGMSAKLGAVKYGQEQGEPFLGRTAGKQSDYSLEVAHEIDEEVRKLIEAAHTEAWEILNTHRDALDSLTAELIEHETLQRKDLERLFASVTKRPRITAFNDFGERTPSDRPPIKTRREIATERGEPWPPEDERQPARVGASNGHAGQNGSTQAGPAQNGSTQNGAPSGWGAPNTPPVGTPAAGGSDQSRQGGDQSGRGAGGWGIPDVYRTGNSSQPPSSVPPNYGAPPGWTPATTPRGTSWESGSRPYGQHGSGQSGQYGSGGSGQSGQYGSGPAPWGSSGGQHAAPEDGQPSGRRSAPDGEQPSGGSFTSPGDGAPNPYGDPDGRRPDGRSES
ncbi:ATP-dependent zinc metalloprotease FtsH [Actinomycetospora sp. TBRC 11914]|uniref:ATP-dependent zinc metalloprotease FtsH n=1 Tax=Actinomycetospora sp. TBRC 11914 TaxID=2729387 RepID=UPI00145E58EC|nr:ATP-dependent zinc metalloprotease FtsH [Actinomycetospora sp. TBRC 11914]NMO89112.1 ATP-dependent zinc metalloprotease FtsH [Actinomycetospora sp. TBRC 11914]